jgi:anti-sigma factor RsiW
MQHQDHDLTLVAGLAAGDLSTPDRDRAQAIVDACAECATIHADLIAIATAMRALPKRVTAPRDFRLGNVQAARLRRGSWLRSFLAPFAGARSATRPMAAAFTSLGLAGLLVATVLPGLLGSAASMAPERQTTGAAAAPTVGAAAAPTAAPAAPVDRAGESDVPAPNGPGAVVDSTASQAPDGAYGAKDGSVGSEVPRTAGQESGGTGVLTSISPPNPLLVGALVLLGIGLVLFGLRFAGRRLR